MFIQQIVIQGFKSYGDYTSLDDLSPHHNIVVGRNGSGKSNFFSAIRFVLGDAYPKLTPEERQSLLHEGNGPAVMSAHVEITFDNSDKRFPTGNDTVVLRRTIGLKKDEYALDKKSVTKSDIMNLLQSAGFSSSNPFYIVPQGRITALTNAKDSERLALLKEVAGCKVYETHRLESLKLIQETQSKRDKIQELLAYIEERLLELDEESKDLKQYHQLDKERRQLEYTVYAREQSEALQQLENMEQVQKAEQVTVDQLSAERAFYEEKATEQEKQMKSTRQQMEALAQEQRQLFSEREQTLQEQNQLSLQLSDLQHQAQEHGQQRRQWQQEKQELESERETLLQKLQQMDPVLNQAKERENQAREQVQSLEGQCDHLFAKQGRFQRYKSARERQEHIQQQLTLVQDTLMRDQQRHTRLEQDLHQVEQSLLQSQQKQSETQHQLDTTKHSLEQLIQRYAALKQERDQKSEQRKELWREEQKSMQQLQQLQEAYKKEERSWTLTLDKSTWSGLQRIETLKDRFPGIYGPVYSLLECDEKWRMAVDAIAGQSLFHVVVDNVETASQVLALLQKENAGRVTFMPLEQLRSVSDDHDTHKPPSTEAISMLDQCHFDARFHNAMKQIFGRAYICRDLQQCTQISQQYKCTTITLDGDRVEKRGAITGGYVDQKKQRLTSLFTCRQLQQKIHQTQNTVTQCQQSLAQVEQEMTQLISQLQQHERQRQQVQEQRESLVAQHHSHTRQLEQYQQQRLFLEQTLEPLKASLVQLNQQKESLLVEATSQQSHWTSTEEASLQQLTRQLEPLKQDLVQATQQRLDMEQQKQKWLVQLQEQIQPRLENIQLHLEQSVLDSSSHESSPSLQDKLQQKQLLLEQMQERDTILSLELDRLAAWMRQLHQEWDQTKQESNQRQSQLDLQQQVLDKSLYRRTVLQHKKEEATRKMAELGLVPDTSEYVNKTATWLLKQLHQVQEQLKKYAHVNKKAFEQYANFTRQRDQLLTRQEELEQSDKAIQEFIQVLDQRKDEAIQRTFHQVGTYFSEIFVRLVPSGRGDLVLKRAALEEDTNETEESSLHYSGVGIDVSFHSTADEGLQMHQLSGGQKSLVALAFIFAIQRCDPAPFYLFDEMDANLDAAHRTAVSQLIASLSQDSQFIMTTFRPELVHVADKFYGVTFENKCSGVQEIEKEVALAFVEREQVLP